MRDCLSHSSHLKFWTWKQKLIGQVHINTCYEIFITELNIRTVHNVVGVIQVYLSQEGLRYCMYVVV